jgi:hypothetical protein
MNRPLILLASSLLITACGVDQEKFEGTYRAGKAIEAAGQIKVTILPDGDQLLTAFAKELSIAKDHASGAAERRLIGAYEDALAGFQGASRLWAVRRDRVGDNGENNPIGDYVRIDRSPGLDKVLASYPVRVDMIAGIEVISLKTRGGLASVVEIVWKGASSKLDAANALLTGH